MDSRSYLAEHEYPRIEKEARRLGFQRINYSRYGSFSAREIETSVDVSADFKYGSDKLTVEISWSSAGMPRPNNERVKKTIKMLQNALKLKAVLQKAI